MYHEIMKYKHLSHGYSQMKTKKKLNCNLSTSLEYEHREMHFDGKSFYAMRHINMYLGII